MRKFLFLSLMFLFALQVCWAQNGRIPSIKSEFSIQESVLTQTVQRNGKTMRLNNVNNVAANNRGGLPAACITWDDPSPTTGWVDFNNSFGGAPCSDEGICPFNEITTFQVWASEAYDVDNFLAGSTYTFSMCNGPGAGSWVPDFTIIAPSGNVDAFGAGDGDGCSITWTATESGTYLIVINRAGFCGTANTINNGYPALTCTGNVPCTPPTCDGGTLVDSDSVAVCPNGTAIIETTGELVPVDGSFNYNFTPAATNLDPGANLVGFSVGAPQAFEFDAGLNGILAANSFPPMNGVWIVTGFVRDGNGDFCAASTESKIVNFLAAEDPACAVEGCNPPTGLNVDEVTSSTASFSWNRNGNESSFDIELVDITALQSPTGEPTHSTEGGSGTIVFTGLEATNDYDAYVRGNCDEEAVDLIITGVFDGPLSGGTPKGIELYALAEIPDLSIYGVSSANNGGGATGTPEYTLSGSIIAGDFIYIASTSTEFQSFFGFTPTFVDVVANINGDDAIELFKNGDVVDVFGEVDVDGTGQPWEYLDGWANRIDNSGPDGSTFVLGNWTFSGINNLEGGMTNGTTTSPFPIGNYSPSLREASDWAGPFSFTTLGAAPANDLCADAEAITCSTNILVAAANATATDNPAVCGGTTGPGVWYSFVGDGQEWTITATPNAWDPEIQILSGACGAFVCEDATDNLGTSGAETASILTVDGTEYFVFVGTWASFDAVIDSFELSVSCETINTCGPFLGDSASNPIVIASVPYSDIQNQEECFTDQYAQAFGSPDVFYQITTGPDASGLIIDLCGDTTDFDTYLYLVDETGTTTLFDNDDTPNAGNPSGTVCSFLDVPVDPNTTYLIVVEGFSETELGWFEITVEEVTEPIVPPANDLCGDAIAIDCNTAIAVAAATATATDNPAVCAGTTGPGVWYSFVGDGQEWTITATPNAWDPEIQILSGACGAFVCETSADNGGTSGAETASLLTVEGTEYYVFVGTWASFDLVIDSFELTISCETIDPCGPFVGDSASNPIVITSLPYSDIQNTAECFTDVYAQAFGSPDVFYQVTTGPDATGLIIDLCNDTTDFNTYLYLVDETGTATLFDNDDNGGICSFLDVPVSPNTTYYIVVEGSLATDEGWYEITVEEVTEPVVTPPNDLCGDAIGVNCETDISVGAAGATATGNAAVCAGTTGPGVWYSFVGDGQEWTITATPNAWDPEIQILSGACGAFVCETSADNGGTSGAETASLLTVEGTEYYVFVGTWASFDLVIDSFELTISCETIDPCGPFVGDSASNPIVITSLPYSDIQNTAECFTDVYAQAFGSPDVFYQVTTGPDATGLIIDLCNDTTDFDTYLYLVDETGTATLFDNDDNGGICSFLDVPVSPNTTYYIVVEGSLATDEGWYEITVEEVTEPVVTPPNDLCGDAIGVNCETDISVGAAGATATGNAAVCAGTTGPGVWYSFVGDGQEWTITATPNAWDPEIQILSGACGAFVCETSADNGGTSGAETASLLTVEGTEYYVFVGTWASFDLVIDSFELTISCETIDPCGPFVGDSASNPIVITSLPYSDIQNTAECFTDVYAQAFGSPDVFYQVTTGPDATGLIIDLCNDTTDFDTYLYLVDETGTATLFDNDDNGGICSFLDVPVSPNTTYYIVVEGSLATDEGWYEITVEEVTEPVVIENDDCSGAVTVSCDDVINGTTVGATAENIAACGTGLSSAPGVWYVFEGTGDEVTFSLCGSSYDTKIGVFSGVCDELVCEAGNDDDCDFQSEVDVLTTLGTSYYIYVTGFNTNAGDFVLSVSCDDPTPAPVNDECAGALELTIGAEGSCDGGAGFVSTSTDGANQSIVTTCDGTIEGDADIWYFFTATSEAISFSSLDGVPGIEVFDGNCGALGNSIGCLNNLSGSIDGLTVGNLYYAVVWTDGEQDAVEFCLQAFTPAECEAGTVTSTDSIALCPDSTTTLTSIGNVVIPSGGAYGIYFEPGPDGGGALEEEFILLNTTTPYAFDNDLNGILSGNGFPEFTGTWYVHGAVYSDPFDAFNSICDITDEFLTVTFLALGEGDCAPAPPVPVNDTCGGAITVSCGDVVNGSTADATAEDLEDCVTSLSSAPGVWYMFEGNGQDVTFSLCGSLFDTKIGVFSGTCDALVCETGNDDACGLQSEATITSTEIGTNYYIYVTGFGTAAFEYTLTITCTEPEPEPGCGTAVYDNGGPAGNYAVNSNDTITICPDNPGEVVTLDFTFVDIEASTFGNGEQDGCWDFITIYNGASTGSAILANTLCGEQSGDGSIPTVPASYLQVGDMFTSTDVSGCLTIVFQSDGSVQEGGFAADITCAEPAVCEVPIDLTVENITETSADLSWTAVGEETIWHLEIVNLTDGGVFTGVPNVSGLTETSYNALGLDPSSDYAFYVIADCGSDSSDWSNPEVFTTLTPAPENDDCAGAIAISCDDVIAGTTVNATAENIEACGTGLSSAPGVWYVFEGNGDDVTFSLCGSGFDTKIGVFTGVCGDLTCEAGNDDECGLQSEVEVSTEVGQDYYVYVTGFSTNAGEFTLSLTCVTPIPVPVNDTCGGAIAVVCNDVITGTTANATAENLDACGTGLSSAPSVWYTFAGTGEDVTFSLCGSEFDTKIGVFTGVCGDLTCEAGNDDACDLQSEIEVSTVVGTNYYVYVTGFGSAAGEFTLSVTCVIPPCDTAQIVAEVTNANCGNDGAIDVSLSGGSGFYDILWSNGETSEDLSGLAAGEYTISVTDLEDGCPATATYTVEGNSALEEPVPAAITTVGCDGSGSASIDVTISGGQEPYIYLWNNGAETEDISGIPADSYALTVTDANGCTYTTQTFEISDTGSIFELLEAVVVDVDCNGSATGSIDVTLAGGVPPYIIRWSNNLHTQDISGLVAGEYIFFATDQTGCEYISSIITVNEPSLIAEASAGIVTNADCNGASTGVIDITVTGGVAPYTYLWTNGSTDEDPSNLAAGVHQATVTDANGCSFLTSVYLVGQPSSITQSAVVTDADCNGGATGAVNITVSGGTPEYSFLWSDGSTDEDLTNAAAGDYTVEISDANGCTIIAGPFTVDEPTAIAVTGLTITDVDCNGNATGAIDIFVQGGTPPYSYSWSNGATTQDISDVPAGDYVGTITDANGCVLVSPTLTVGEPAVISVSSLEVIDADCNGASTGTINIEVNGGTAPYTYSWSNGATTQDLVGVPAGEYVGTITDANGCVLVSPELTVGEPSAIQITSVTVTDVLCNGGLTGAIDIEVSGGTGSYSYSWSNGATSQDLNDIAAGDYTGTITDENGCVLVATVTVDEPAAIFEALPPAVTNVTCNGDEDGEITATVQGGTLPYTITWNTGATGETIGDLAPGTYFYTVVDGNGCTFASDEIEVGTPAPLTIAGEVGNVACFGEASGFVTIVVDGGTAPYTYVWSNGATSQNILGLEVGDYSVSVTDANGCNLTSSTITVSGSSSALEASVEVTDATGNGIADGSATVTVEGGDGPYSFEWQGGFGDSETISDLQAGIYCVDVTDANGCVFTACGTVGFPTAIKDLLEISQLTLYPNPTTNYTNLVIGLSKAADIQLAVVDILGKEYQHQNLTNVETAEVQFNLSSFAAGTYFIRIVVDKEMISLPVIVQH